MKNKLAGLNDTSGFERLSSIEEVRCLHRWCLEASEEEAALRGAIIWVMDCKMTNISRSVWLWNDDSNGLELVLQYFQMPPQEQGKLKCLQIISLPHNSPCPLHHFYQHLEKVFFDIPGNSLTTPENTLQIIPPSLLPGWC
ncbi:hypothetical protein O181_019291 [Austropuccinia psidii MF-1]|uniref:Uncharacterized protein n=1 Tax=Austropuccinia psidii MF-1 TaxID=1389203 RepID=A0A9Q3GTQ4_9BASI|nr:hypothetical protein [Austropuccinia psidii MF-1]